jgi:hypothetical protein
MHYNYFKFNMHMCLRVNIVHVKAKCIFVFIKDIYAIYQLYVIMD